MTEQNKTLLGFVGFGIIISAVSLGLFVATWQIIGFKNYLYMVGFAIGIAMGMYGAIKLDRLQVKGTGKKEN